MKRFLPLCRAILVLGALIGVAGPALAQDGDLDAVQRANDGWTEESPGLWTLPLGERGYRLRAEGEDAMQEVLVRLRRKSQELLQRDLGTPSHSARLIGMLSLIDRIEAGRRQPLQTDVPDCTRTSTAYGGASTTTHQCGVQAWALASVTSTGIHCGSCDVDTLTWASGACSPSSRVEGRFTSCSRSGKSVACTSHADWLMPYQCEGGAWATVYCFGYPAIDIYDLDEETTCGTGLPCYCSGGF